MLDLPEYYLIMFSFDSGREYNIILPDNVCSTVYNSGGRGRGTSGKSEESLGSKREK